MRAWIFLLILAIMPAAVLASQEAEDIFASEAITIDVTVSSDITLTPKNGDLDVKYLQADLYFFPKEDDAQKIISVTSQPNADKMYDSLRFRWEPPESTQFGYRAQATVQVRNFFPRVMKKIKFPLTSVHEEAQEYLKPSEHIDSNNPAIINIANRLAQGHDDLFEVVSEFAIWTKTNVVYNLSTLTADVSQKASWVLENRQGVCDELTSLFIAFCRSVGIPARFVTGVSYTSSPLFTQHWGAHGWAEVYFPQVGWVPFDPTFGEFGWVDPGHVKMITGADSEQPGVRFEWQGNANMQYTRQKIEASITSITKRIPPIIAIEVKPIYDEVGFGSYNLAQVTVENLQPYYITTELRLARVNELESIEPLDRQVVLKPREKKTLFWRFQVDPGLYEKFVYTVPVGVYTVMNDSVIGTFVAKAQGVHHTREDVTRVMNTLSEDDEKVVSQNIEISCVSDKEAVYPGDSANVNCTLRNTGTTPLKSVTVCIDEKQCSAIDIGIGMTRQVSFAQGFTSAGSNTIFVRAKSPELSKSTPLPIEMLDAPSVNITELSYPATIAYGKQFTLLFLLKPASYNTPKKVHLTVKTPAGKRLFEIPELTDAQPFEIEINSDELSLGTSDILIEAAYTDDRGKLYKKTATAPITLTDIPFFPKIWLWFRGLFW
jgi:transglutaminase-like putative cysteine protease